MADPFLGEIRINAFSFAPTGWAKCDGQVMQIQQNQALAVLLGNVYGGDAKTTFGLPDLRGRVPLCFGQGANLSPYAMGAKGGAETVAVAVNQLPQHTHAFNAVNTLADKPGPTGRFYGATPVGTNLYVQPTAPTQMVPLAPGAISINGGGQAHNNMQQYIALNFCIALSGYWPQRN